jgi:hypothetical protein
MEEGDTWTTLFFDGSCPDILRKNELDGKSFRPFFQFSSLGRKGRKLLPSSSFFLRISGQLPSKNRVLQPASNLTIGFSIYPNSLSKAWRKGILGQLYFSRTKRSEAFTVKLVLPQNIWTAPIEK